MGIFDQHASGLAFDAANPPRRVAEQDDVAAIAFDGEVFVERADHGAFRLGDHGEEGSLGNGATTGDGRQSRAAPRPQLAVDPVVMDIGAIASAARGDAFGEHFENAS